MPVPMPQLLRNLIEKGVAKRFYLAITLEDVVILKALVDTTADITLMSTSLFTRLQNLAAPRNKTLRTRECSLDIQNYSAVGTWMNQVIPIHLSIGPMQLMDPMYISQIKSIPLLISNNLQNRFKPLLDFQCLKIWGQVREPLPFTTSGASSMP